MKIQSYKLAHELRKKKRVRRQQYYNIVTIFYGYRPTPSYTCTYFETVQCAVTLPIKMYYISMGLHQQRQVSLYIIITLHYYIVDSDAVIGKRGCTGIIIIYQNN